MKLIHFFPGTEIKVTCDLVPEVMEELVIYEQLLQYLLESKTRVPLKQSCAYQMQIASVIMVLSVEIIFSL